MRGVGGSFSGQCMAQASDAGRPLDLCPGPSVGALESCKVPQVIAKYCITLAGVPELSWPGLNTPHTLGPGLVTPASAANQRPSVTPADQWEAGGRPLSQAERTQGP